MIVRLKSRGRLMVVEKFVIDDFSDRFCDRLECSWQHDGIEKRAIFNYEDVEVTGIHVHEIV